MSDWESIRRDPVALEQLMRRALRENDVKGAHAALSLLAVVDPRRAESLLDVIRLHLSMHQANYCFRSGECALPGGHPGDCEWQDDDD